MGLRDWLAKARESAVGTIASGLVTAEALIPEEVPEPPISPPEQAPAPPAPPSPPPAPTTPTVTPPVTGFPDPMGFLQQVFSTINSGVGQITRSVTSVGASPIMKEGGGVVTKSVPTVAPKEEEIKFRGG